MNASSTPVPSQARQERLTNLSAFARRRLYEYPCRKETFSFPFLFAALLATITNGIERRRTTARKKHRRRRKVTKTVM